MNLRRLVVLAAAAVWPVPDAVRATKPAEPWRRPRSVDPSGAPLTAVSAPATAREPWCRFCFEPCTGRCERVDSWEPAWAWVERAGGEAS